MAQWDKFRGLFCRHDAGNARNSEHIAFFRGAGLDHLQGCGLHVNATSRNGTTMGNFLGGDVDHMRIAVLIEMGQFTHCSGLVVWFGEPRPIRGDANAGFG